MLVWKKLAKLQRRFNWDGVKDGFKVVWEDVCKVKNLGGLGVKDLRFVNLALFSRWQWRLVVEGNCF